MKRDFAIRLDGMLMSTQGILNTISHHIKENVEAGESDILIKKIAYSMTILLEISTHIYGQHQDIKPKHLQPDEAADEE